MFFQVGEDADQYCRGAHHKLTSSNKRSTESELIVVALGKHVLHISQAA